MLYRGCLCHHLLCCFLSVYNTCLRQLLDHHAPLVTRTVTDRPPAPFMPLEVKRRPAKRKWHESGLTAHREPYAKQSSLVSNFIRKAMEDCMCEQNVNCGGSRELFRLINQVVDTFGDTTLPTNISPEFPPEKFNDFFKVRLNRLEAALTLTDQSPLTRLCSLPFSLQKLIL